MTDQPSTYEIDDEDLPESTPDGTVTDDEPVTENGNQDYDVEDDTEGDEA